MSSPTLPSPAQVVYAGETFAGYIGLPTAMRVGQVRLSHCPPRGQCQWESLAGGGLPCDEPCDKSVPAAPRHATSGNVSCASTFNHPLTRRF